MRCDPALLLVFNASIWRGDLGRARKLATLHHRIGGGCDRELPEAYQSAVDRALAVGGTEYLQDIYRAHQAPGSGLKVRDFELFRPLLRPPQRPCWNESSRHGNAEIWDSCCSSLVIGPGIPSRDCGFGDNHGLVDYCCAFGSGSDSYLRIPALMEIRVVVLAGTRHLIQLHQDGWLRPYDVSTVLWPAGFFLAVHIAAHCPRYHGLRILDLGTGTGIAAITLAKCGAQVTAVDNSWQALALTMSNAASNGVRVAVHDFDWTSDVHASTLASQSFDAIVGAPGGKFFEPNATAYVWSLLTYLLFDGADSQILLVGSTGIVNHSAVPCGFVVADQTLSGRYHITSRDGAASEFELWEIRRATQSQYCPSAGASGQQGSSKREQ